MNVFSRADVFLFVDFSTGRILLHGYGAIIAYQSPLDEFHESILEEMQALNLDP